MKTVMFDLPEDKRQWPEWLERQIVGKRLGQLVAELEAFEDTETPATLESVCGDKLPLVLQHGLKRLSIQEIGALLRHPKLLLELQQQTFAACSSYWDDLVGQDERPTGRPTVAAIAETKGTESATPATDSVTPVKGKVTKVERLWSVLAVAAGLLISVGIWQSFSGGEQVGWGLAKVTSLSPDLGDAEYLLELSQLAGAWDNKTPPTTETLIARLEQFKTGCDTLRRAPKPQLQEVDQIWLAKSCQEWSGELGVLIQQLRNGSIDYHDGLLEANRIAEGMESALIDKAEELA